MPPYLELDLTGAEVMDNRSVSDLAFPPGITPLLPPETTVCNVKKLTGRLALEAQQEEAAAAEEVAEGG